MPYKPNSIFQMSRPIIEGAGELLNLAEFFAERSISPDYENASYRPDRYAVFGKNADGLENGPEFQSLVGRKQYGVKDSLILPIVQISMPASYRSFFNRVALQLDSEVKQKNPDLRVWDAVHELDFSFGIENPEQVTATADDIIISQKPDSGEYNLALAFQPEALLKEEHTIVMEAVKYLANKRMKAMLGDLPSYQPVASLVKLSAGVQEQEVVELRRHLLSELPVRLVLGDLMSPMVK